MSVKTAVPGAGGLPVVLSRRVDPSAVAALFRMTVARLVRGRRLTVFVLLFSLPIVLAVLAQRYEPRYEPEGAEKALIFALIPQALVPLTALIFASGMVQDEVEEQTLTYLLIRPLPRGLIYATKLAGTFFVTAALTAVFTWITYAVVYEFEPSWDAFLYRPLKTAASTLLALAVYGSLFAFISLFWRRTLVIGVAYIIVFEGIFANIDFVIRKVTIMYQLRVLSIRWLDLTARDWNINLDDAPSLSWAALNLAIAAAAFTALGSFVFAHREFRMKTPEGA